MLDEIADRIAAATGNAAKRSGEGYSLRCPAHEDRSPSLALHLSPDGERALIKCHAGCETGRVLSAAGLSERDLFLNRGTGDPRGAKVVPLHKSAPTKPGPNAKAVAAIAQAADGWDAYLDGPAGEVCAAQVWTVEGLRMLHSTGDIAGVAPGRSREYGGRLRLAYRDAEGTPTGYADRATLDRHLDVPEPKKVHAHGSRNLWPRPESIADLPGLNPEPDPLDAILGPADDAVPWVVIVEGEADALALWSVGIPAVGVPGVKAWKRDYADRFARFGRVLVIADADKEGRELADAVAYDLWRLGLDVEVGDPDPGTLSKRDARDLLRDVGIHSIAGLRQALHIHRAADLFGERPEDAPADVAESAEDATEDTEGIEPFRVWSVTEMMEWPEPDPLIHGVLTVGDRFGIVAPFSSGKSAVALDMALRIAAGMPWHGHEVAPGGVIYVAAENAYGFPKRIKAWGLANGVDTERLPFLLIRDPMKLNGGRLDDLRLLETVRQAQARWDVPVRVVYLDTVRRTLEGKENESDVFQAYVDACDRISTRTGAAVGLVHHSPKSAEENPGGRGSGVWNDALAPILALRAKGEPGAVTVHVTCDEKRGGKPPKDLEPFGPMTFHLVGVETGDVDRYGARLSGVVAVEGAHPKAEQDEADRRADVILETLRQDGPQTRTALCRVLGGRKAAALDAIRDLEERGVIVAVGRQGKAPTLGLPPVQEALDAP